MKNILLATTALVMTAGFASAEVKFSGKGEGGVSRTAKTDAVAVVYGVQTPYALVTTKGVTKGTVSTTAATATTVAAAKIAVTSAQAVLDQALSSQATAVLAMSTAALRAAEVAVGATSATAKAVALAQANLLIAQKNLAEQELTPAAAAVAAGDIAAYSGYDFDVSLSGASDNGITFAAGFDMGAGSLADTTDDLALEVQSGAVGAPTVSASMNGYTVAFKSDGIDDLYDDSQNGDVSVAGTIGGVTFKVVHDLEADVAGVAAADATFLWTDAGAIGTVETGEVVSVKAAVAAVAAVYNTTSYTLGTTVGGIGLSLTGTDKNDKGLSGMKAKATYAMDALTFGLETNNRGDSTKMLNATKVSVAYAGEGVSVSASSNDDKDWDLSATLSAGANSATFVTDEESEWNAQVASDLGGGASVFGYVDHTELFMAGVRFKF